MLSATYMVTLSLLTQGKNLYICPTEQLDTNTITLVQPAFADCDCKRVQARKQSLSSLSDILTGKVYDISEAGSFTELFFKNSVRASLFCILLQ